MLDYVKQRYVTFLQILALHSYLYILLFIYDGDRHLSHYLYIVGLTSLLSLGLQKVYKRPLHFDLSVWITCCACYLLVVTKHTLWPYVLAALLGVASKFIITVDRKHIFNPANFGLLFCLCAFSETMVMSAGQWLGSTAMILFFIAFGLFVAIVANRWVLAVVYISSFLILRLIKYEMSGINLYFLIGPLLSVASFVFTFHMITDPKTSPEPKWGQVVFGIALALADFFFREQQMIFAPMVALAVVCALRGLLLGVGNSKIKELLRARA